MRKIISLRETQEFSNREKLKKQILPIIVTALLLVLSVICAMAAELLPQEEEDITDSTYVEEISSLDSAKPARATVKVICGGYEYAVCNSKIMTARQLLERIGIELRDNMAVSADLDSEIYDGLVLTVGIYTTEVYSEEIEIPFDIEYKPSGEIPKGQTKLVSEGKAGARVITREINYLDGVVVSENVISECDEIAPVNAVYYKGVGGTVTSKDGTVYNYSHYIDVVATAYHTGGITATGHVANEEVVAVDPKVIPYGTKMFITGNWGEVGYRSAEDCGNFKGKHIDVCMEGTREELLQFGRRKMRVYILE